MRILKLTCTIFMIAGCFRPQSWTSLFKRTVYNVYRLYVISMLYTFTLSQVIDVVMNTDNPNDFTDNLNKSLTVSVSCYKIFIAWLSYKNIAALINYLTEEPFKPLDLGEMKIRRQYDKIIRNNTLRYTILIATSWTSLSLTSLLTDFRHRKLTYRGWIPYDYSSYATFCFTYAVQVLSTFHCIVVNVACDTLLCGFLMHICCQIEILEYRLRKFLCNQFSLGYCIRHHNRIFEFARMVNTRFTQIIGLQFMASTMVTCFNLYQLTKSALGTNHVLTIIYTICMLTQIFIYCWFGNRVKLKSLQLTNSIFQMEWPIVENSVKKGILIIMKRAMTPIEISTIYILNINLDSFVVLLKTSYSVYNVLLQVPE
ncbi:putative odorant receptor 85d [Temnothorax nylanderi]|uniref:putative odorant receptor 85d n=1 Tax=Temnothorax nylanderi TaxID=102681 RepID=UPI003A883210